MENENQLHVPSFDLVKQIEDLKSELIACIERVLVSGRFILGPEVESFEREVAEYLEVKHAVGVANGTDALWLALKALGVGSGDKVLTSPFSFFSTAGAIVNAGAQPVFVDIDPQTLNILPDRVREVLEGRSELHRELGVELDAIKAIMPVHLFGQAADMSVLQQLARDYGLVMVEDAAQAIGAEHREKKVGTFAELGCFSFFPTKNLGAFGDGGLVVTKDETLASRVRILRVHGASQKHFHEIDGTNSRLDSLQAALLRLRLHHLDRWTAQRQRHATLYTELLSGIDWITTPQPVEDQRHVYNQYTIRVHGRRREGLKSYLAQRGVETTEYYPLPLHLQPALQYLGYEKGAFPQAERASQQVLSLPMFPELASDQIEWVASSIKAFERTRISKWPSVS